MTLNESMTVQARALGTRTLWLLEIIALFFVAAGVFIFLVDSSRWPLATASIVFFGFCAVNSARLLAIKKRDPRTEQDSALKPHSDRPFRS